MNGVPDDSTDAMISIKIIASSKYVTFHKSVFLLLLMKTILVISSFAYIYKTPPKINYCRL